MDYKAIINLMKEMNHTELTKLLIEEEGFKICLEKAGSSVSVLQPSLSPINMAPQAYPINPAVMQQVSPAIQTVQSFEAGQTNTPVSEAASQPAEDTNCSRIVSPMVGTFYSSPSPDKPVFVKVGDKVKKGQPVCIIEAMKLMNEIESDQDGEIVKILVNNEQMVEFGQPLFLVK